MGFNFSLWTQKEKMNNRERWITKDKKGGPQGNPRGAQKSSKLHFFLRKNKSSFSLEKQEELSQDVM